MDLQVDLLLSRDLVRKYFFLVVFVTFHNLHFRFLKDSDAAKPREVAAVEEFLADEKFTLHSMRDHPQHK